jgi:transposase-like protein
VETLRRVAFDVIRSRRAVAIFGRPHDKQVRLIDFTLSDRRNTKAAHCFLAKALKVMRNWPPVEVAYEVSLK